MLTFDAVHMPVAEVLINGQKAGMLAYAPFTVDITPYVRAGDNEIVLRCFTSCRNLLGPHHYAEESYSIGRTPSGTVHAPMRYAVGLSLCVLGLNGDSGLCPHRLFKRRVKMYWQLLCERTSLTAKTPGMAGGFPSAKNARMIGGR